MTSSAERETPSTETSDRPPWSVLLIGGNSGAGKTTVANMIGRRLGVNVAQADTYRLLAERVSTSMSAPPPIEPAVTPEEHCAMLQRRAESLRVHLEIVTAYHVATRAPLILEGDCLLPVFAVQRMHAYVPVAKHIRAVFLLDRDRPSVHYKQRLRGRGFTLLSPERQATLLDGDLLYADWLRDEAAIAGCAVLETAADISASDLASQIIDQLELSRGDTSATPEAVDD